MELFADEIPSSLRRSNNKPKWTFAAASEDSLSGRISDLASLSCKLPLICSQIYSILGEQQNERTYQSCLKVDLERAGVKVREEVEIELVYRGVAVGTRRADLVLTLPSGEKAVIEMKAVETLSPRHSEQLRYYMQALNIHNGYLINMPHDDGFPEIGPVAQFTLKGLIGTNDGVDRLKPRIKRDKDGDARTVQIVQAQLKVLHGEEKRMFLEAKVAEAQQKPDVALTREGLPCKICIKMGGRHNCRFHRNSKYTGQAEIISLNEEENKRVLLQSTGGARIALTKAGLPCKICIREGGCQNCQWHYRKATSSAQYL